MKRIKRFSGVRGSVLFGNETIHADCRYDLVIYVRQAEPACCEGSDSGEAAILEVRGQVYQAFFAGEYTLITDEGYRIRFTPDGFDEVRFLGLPITPNGEPLEL